MAKGFGPNPTPWASLICHPEKTTSPAFLKHPQAFRCSAQLLFLHGLEFLVWGLL